VPFERDLLGSLRREKGDRGRTFPLPPSTPPVTQRALRPRSANGNGLSSPLPSSGRSFGREPRMWSDVKGAGEKNLPERFFWRELQCHHEIL